MTGTVNVGTIGHVDHSKSTLTAALVKVLGEKSAKDVVIVDEASTHELRRSGLIRDAVTETIEHCYGDLFGRVRSPSRKAERKARLRDLQRRAFAGEKQP